MTAADHARHARDLRRASRDPHLNATEAAALWAESEIAQGMAATSYVADKHDASEAMDA